MDSVKEKKAASAAGNASAGDTGVLVQPIVAYAPEPGHKPEDVLTVQQLIDLLREEEDYWAGEQTNTKLMITRLRKIFYDEWGWNSELIRGATDIEQRYVVEIVDDATVPTAEVRRFRSTALSRTATTTAFTGIRWWGRSRSSTPAITRKSFCPTDRIATSATYLPASTRSTTRRW
jgi:hypothetical protein